MLKLIKLLKAIQTNKENFYNLYDILFDTIEELQPGKKDYILIKILESINAEKNSEFVLQGIIESLEDSPCNDLSYYNDFIQYDFIFNLLEKKLPLFIEIDCQDWEAVENIDYKKTDFVQYEIKSDSYFNDYILITKIL